MRGPWQEGLCDEAWEKERIEYWSDVYGYDMTALSQWPRSEFCVDTVPAAAVASDRALLRHIDIMAVTKAELEFTAPFKLVASRAGKWNGVVVTFDTTFSRKLRETVVLGTGVRDELTHWRHARFPVDAPFDVAEGETVQGTWSCRRRASNPREWEAELTVEGKGEDGGLLTQRYMLE